MANLGINCNVAEDWVGLWQHGQPIWHKPHVHPSMKKHGSLLLGDKSNVKIFVPLCGKSIDMKWFADMGHTVVGVDVAGMVLQDFFKENNITYAVEATNAPEGTLYKSADGKIRLYCCNIFDFNREIEGTFDAVWDRGGLGSFASTDACNFPQKYCDTMQNLMTSETTYLVESFEYDTDTYTDNIPQSVPLEKVVQYFNRCIVQHLDRRGPEPGEATHLKGVAFNLFKITLK